MTYNAVCFPKGINDTFVGPRFALIAFGYMLNRQTFPSSSLPAVLSVVGVLRTLTCGGWVYITSSDDHDVHDVLMILYIVLNLPWMFGNIRLSQGEARRQRCVLAILGHSHALRTSPSVRIRVASLYAIVLLSTVSRRLTFVGFRGFGSLSFP